MARLCDSISADVSCLIGSRDAVMSCPPCAAWREVLLSGRGAARRRWRMGVVVCPRSSTARARACRARAAGRARARLASGRRRADLARWHDQARKVRHVAARVGGLVVRAAVGRLVHDVVVLVRGRVPPVLRVRRERHEALRVVRRHRHGRVHEGRDVLLRHVEAVARLRPRVVVGRPVRPARRRDGQAPLRRRHVDARILLRLPPARQAVNRSVAERAAVHEARVAPPRQELCVERERVRSRHPAALRVVLLAGEHLRLLELLLEGRLVARRRRDATLYAERLRRGRLEVAGRRAGTAERHRRVGQVLVLVRHAAASL
eukprot:7385095-Prymnesium_polylepis.1